MKRLSPVPLAALLFALGPSQAPADSRQDAASTSEHGEKSLESLLTQLRETVAAMDENVARQEAAWPTREEDQLREMAPPLAVRQLQAKLDELAKRKQGLLWRLRSAGSKEVKLVRSSRNQQPVDVGPVLEELKRAKSLSLLEGLVPAAVLIGKEDPRTADVLMSLPERFDPCPSFVIRALSDLEDEDAGFFLLQLGTEKRSVPILQAAGDCGLPGVVGGLIELAGRDTEAGRAALRALNRIGSQLGPKRAELKNLVTERLWSARSSELKVALVLLLGRFKDPDTYTVFETSYELSQDESVRLAVIGAMGQVGKPATKFLLERLRDTDASLRIRRASANALGVATHGAAVPHLVEYLSDPQLKEDAWRSLRRIAGQDLGVNKTPWLRWWAARKGEGYGLSEEETAPASK